MFSENVVFFGLLRPEKASLLSGAQGALFSFWSFFLKFLESLSFFMRVAFKFVICFLFHLTILDSCCFAYGFRLGFFLIQVVLSFVRTFIG